MMVAVQVLHVLISLCPAQNLSASRGVDGSWKYDSWRRASSGSFSSRCSLRRYIQREGGREADTHTHKYTSTQTYTRTRTNRRHKPHTFRSPLPHFDPLGSLALSSSVLAHTGAQLLVLLPYLEAFERSCASGPRLACSLLAAFPHRPQDQAPAGTPVTRRRGGGRSSPPSRPSCPSSAGQSAAPGGRPAGPRGGGCGPLRARWRRRRPRRGRWRGCGCRRRRGPRGSTTGQRRRRCGPRRHVRPGTCAHAPARHGGGAVCADGAGRLGAQGIGRDGSRRRQRRAASQTAPRASNSTSLSHALYILSLYGTLSGLCPLPCGGQAGWAVAGPSPESAGEWGRALAPLMVLVAAAVRRP